ncbi:hypothetical protein BJX65DRAFT_284044 [Aspergillus insuetus]
MPLHGPQHLFLVRDSCTTRTRGQSLFDLPVLPSAYIPHRNMEIDRLSNRWDSGQAHIGTGSASECDTRTRLRPDSEI